MVLYSARKDSSYILLLLDLLPRINCEERCGIGVSAPSIDLYHIFSRRSNDFY